MVAQTLVRRVKSVKILLLAASLVVFLGDARAEPGKATDSISALQGNATIVRMGKTMPAAYGTPLQVGDQISTAAGSHVTVTLSDGTQLELGESGTFILANNSLNPDGSRAATTIELKGGLLHSLVRSAPGSAPNYEVRTPNVVAVAAVPGTDYDTDYIQGENRTGYKDCREFSDVAVHEGEVDVTSTSNPGAGAVKLKKDHHTTGACALVLLPPSVGALVAAGALGVAGAAAVGATVWGITSGGESSPTRPSSPTSPSQ